MQKYLLLPLFLPLFLCLSFLGQAQDVTVDTGPLILNPNGTVNTSGFISFTFDPDILPIDIWKCSEPCTGISPPPIYPLLWQEDHDEQFLDINVSLVECTGEYCFTVVDVDEPMGNDCIPTETDCFINFCVDVFLCQLLDTPWGSTIKACPHSTPEGSNDDALFLTGNTNGNGSIIGSFEVVSSISQTDFDLIKTQVMNGIDTEVSNIITTGSSAYQVASQNEVATNDEFVFKFDMNGNVVWVYYVGSGQQSLQGNNHNGISTEEDVAVDKSVKTPVLLSSSGLSFYNIYPNPFRNSFKIEIESDIAENAEIKIMGMNGSLVKKVEQPLAKGLNTIEIAFEKPLPDGIYFIEMINGEGHRIVEKVVKSGK